MVWDILSSSPVRGSPVVLLFLNTMPFPSCQHYELGNVPEQHRTRNTGDHSSLPYCYPQPNLIVLSPLALRLDS